MTLRFERSTDYELIGSILTNAAAYRRMVNDSAPEPEDLFIGPVAGFSFIVAFDEQSALAVFMLGLNKFAPGIAETHFCMIPQAWGRTRDIAEGFLSWVWRETSIYRLVGPMPEYNRLALRLAKAVGFRQFDVKVNAGQRNGVNFDIAMMQLDRPVMKGASA